MIFHFLATPFSSLIFVSIIHWFSAGFCFHFWCVVDTFPVRTCNLLNHQNTYFQMIFNDFALQRIKIFDYFPDLFDYQFWYWFWMSFGINFGSNLGFLWHQVSCLFGDRFFDEFLHRFLIQIRPNNWFFLDDRTLYFRILFPHTCTFYHCKTYECQKPAFPLFSFCFFKDENI